MEDIFNGLNDRQMEAVKSTEGYYRIIAGAGSGKTRTITHRFAYLVRELGINPGNILCITFTNKAANEMKTRIKKLLGDGYDGALITTYHGFCARVLREDIHSLFYPENFKIIDVAEQKRILEDIYAEYKIKMDYNTFEKTMEYIMEEKTHLEYISLMTDPAYIFHPGDSSDLGSKIYFRYLETQKKLHALDFNDLLYFVLHLFGNNEPVLNKWKNRLHYIQVDEFQDSSKKEIDLINFLCGGNDNLFVVGDPDQNIYEWRKSNNSFLVYFDQNYPNVETIILNQNYRSTPEILNASNSLIEKNKNRIKKELFTVNSGGSEVEYYHCKTEDEEARIMVDKIIKLTKKGYKYSDIAILYRSTYVSRFAEQTLYSNDIPYQIYGGIRFFDRNEIKDALAYLKLVYSNDDDSFLRIINTPKRRFGRPKIAHLKRIQEETGQALFDILAENIKDSIFNDTGASEFVNVLNEFKNKTAEEIKISDLLNSLLERVGYKAYISQNGDMERYDNVTELINSIDAFEKSYGENVTAEDYLRQTVLMSDYESEKNLNCIRLMTIHAAKGLEFPCVIVVGMTDGVIPSKRTLEERKEDGLEEERRLLYVAMTRAKNELILSESEGVNNGAAIKLPSRFIFDISGSLLKIIGQIPDEIKKQVLFQSGRLKSRIAEMQNNNADFNIGDKVEHKIFGLGEIVGEDNSHTSYMVQFKNNKNPKPISKSFKGLVKYDSDMPSVKNESRIPVSEINNNQSTESGKNPHDELHAKTYEQLNTEEIVRFLPVIDDLPEKAAKPNDSDVFRDNKKDGDEEEIERFLQRELDKISGIVIEDEYISRPKKSSSGANVSSDANINSGTNINSGAGTNLWNNPNIPKKGWICTGIYDLGYPSGTCGMCGKEEIRYVHVMEHEHGGQPLSLNVGCICAGKMEGDMNAAKERERDVKNRAGRMTTFINKDLKTSGKGNLYVKYKDVNITFFKTKDNPYKWTYVANDEFSGKFDTLDEAKKSAFLKYDCK